MAKANPFQLTTDAVQCSTIAAASTDLATNRFVTSAGGYPAAGGYAIGHTLSAASAGKPVSVMQLGDGVIEAGAAIASADIALAADATGKAVPAAAGDEILGRSIDTATGTGTEYIRYRRSAEGILAA